MELWRQTDQRNDNSKILSLNKDSGTAKVICKVIEVRNFTIGVPTPNSGADFVKEDTIFIIGTIIEHRRLS